ncbi:MAG: hypothetical protein WD051_14050 [Steroidobacteraceae bacterium]
MSTIVLPQGQRKLIIADTRNAGRNLNRLQSGGSRLLPLYLVIVLDEAGNVAAKYRANLEPITATLQIAPSGIHKKYPATAAVLQQFGDVRLFFFSQTTEALTLELPDVAA